MDKASQTNVLFGASDASLNKGHATHAWNISSGQLSDICSRNSSLSGSGLVDGLSTFLSSTRGELKGITAVTIMGHLLNDFQSTNLPISILCDTKSVQQKSQKISKHRLCHHHFPTIDLYLTQQGMAKQS